MDFKAFVADIGSFASAKKKKRGFFAGLAMSFADLIKVVFLLIVLVYAGYSLTTSLNNSNATIIWNNTVGAVINFTNQLGTVGTIAGIVLILALIYLFAAPKLNEGRGSGM